MAGHSKWSQIKRKKAKTDAQRGKVFSKISREIIMAVKLGGDEADSNPRLRLAIQKAKSENMPNENIKKAISKGAGEGGNDNLEEVFFEAYGPFGIGMLIKSLTENRNRTVPNIRAILTRNAGNMAEKGAVSYMYNTKGLFIFSPDAMQEKIVEVAVNIDAEDINIQDDQSIEVLTKPEDFEKVRAEFERESINYEDAMLTKIPSTMIQISEEDSLAIFKLIDKLEEDDDVQEVFTNFEIN
ncbi:YebC/PmpR family DNA-binding transcriptional regulator [Candidatus Marinamargulisbacteria bacterium SCGC AG-410-N11]|nr:YebC/PmpR family DNA-binding transcriptional regulator [Candidatus Marinamargulisbacteria bacterium SCGC AG-410-N11]